MRILLTGAAGFIGGRVHAALRSAGHDVVAVDTLLEAAHGPGGVLPEVHIEFEFTKVKSGKRLQWYPGNFHVSIIKGIIGEFSSVYCSTNKLHFFNLINQNFYFTGAARTHSA